MTPSADRAAGPGRLVIGSRRSRLARTQARAVGDALRAAWPGLDVEYVGVSTAGDRDRETPLPEIGGKGLFTEALEEALAAGDLDLAVHSLKDLPTGDDDSLVAIPKRADPRDVLVLARPFRGLPIARLPRGLRVGTSSTRRTAQLLRAIPGVRVEPLRGNVETRLARLDGGDLDGIVLAAAGLSRLGLTPKGARAMAPADWLPAPGQGALAVQGRSDDDRVRRLAAAIDDRDTATAVRAERSLLARLGGGCHVPVAALGTSDGATLVLRGMALDPDRRGRAVEAEAAGAADDAVAVGERVAELLLARGASDFLTGSPPR